MQPSPQDLTLARTVIEAALRAGLVIGLVVWCFVLARPFLVPVLWGVIVAIAAYPGFLKIRARLGGRDWLAAMTITALGLLLLVLPLSMLATSLVETTATVAERLRGDLSIPPPPASLAAVPLVGVPMTRLWSLATTNLGAALAQVAPHLRPVGDWALGLVAGAGFGVLHFIAAMIVAGILLAHADAAAAAAHRIARRLVGERGPRLALLAEGTIRNVTRGLLGTAAVQSLLAGVGFVVAGVPGAAVLTLVSFVLCVVQLGPAIVLFGAVVWMFATADPLTAGLFTVWAVLVGLSDNVLRPYLLAGRDGVPMLVLLIGVLGGLLAHGLIGLFVGPIVFALGYELLRAWALERDGEA